MANKKKFMKNIQLIRVIVLLFSLIVFNSCDQAVEPIDPALINNLGNQEGDCQSPESVNGAFSSATSITISWSQANNETSWQIQYGPAGFALGAGTIISSTSTSRVINGLQAATSYDFLIRSVCSATEFGEWSEPFTVTPPNPNCSTPSGLTVVRNSGNSTATVNWTAGGTETSWQVLYVPAGLSIGQGTTLTATSKPFTVSNLTNDSYDFYVRAKCSATETSSWSPLKNLAAVSTGGSEFYLKMKIDGVLKVFSYPTDVTGASYSDFALMILSTDGINSFALNITTPDGVGNYPLSFAEVTCSYIQGNNGFNSDYDDLTTSPGNIVITELNQSPNTIKGTFNFIGKNDGMTQTRIITEGEFYLPY